ncbi:MAG: galactitol-1-phosphate 5-dehydrogenase [Spirochaetes bacterium GWF1_41_5]|nr:MAG: galactitol-1-phosphate 5-dehydrogenase [Spirochaetes bacterium GWF1_41_5]HBE02507.1 galactitol-1-phosphate 5-dehydrogenase [Spirochaetia bacterium]
MKALIHNKVNDFVYSDTEKPAVNDNEVLIRIKAVGICGSDVHGMTGKTGRRKPPVIMGHEAAGIIEEKGKNAAGFMIGDRVTFDSTIYCGHCSFCRQGKINLCANRRVFGVSCDEYRQNGAMAEYLAVPEHILYKIPAEMSFAQAAMIEALSIAFHAVGRSGLKINDTVTVFGCGIIGLLIIQSARLAGCGKIIAVDLDDYKLEFAEKFGADLCLNPLKKNIPKNIEDFCSGADIVFEAVGVQVSVNQAVLSCKKGGKIILVGNLSPEIIMPLQKIVTGELTLLGSCASSGEYQACINMIAGRRINVDKLISKIVPLSEGKKWFAFLLEGKEPLFKIVLEP